MQYIMFSKLLQELTIDQLGDAVKDVGFDGVDLTVRSNGHILPENVKRKLPEAARILRDKGLDIPMLTTEIVSSSTPGAEDIIATAAELGIRLLKLGYWQYRGFGHIKAQMEGARADLDTLSPLAEKHDVCLCLHTHSGDFLTATPAQMVILLAGHDPEHFGAYCDLGHMTSEGGMSGWKIGLDLLADHIKIVAAKGMGWMYYPGIAGERGEWRNVILPVKESAVRWQEAFGYLKEIGFTGPVSVHSEYGGSHSWRDLQTTDEILAQTSTDLAYLKSITG